MTVVGREQALLVGTRKSLVGILTPAQEVPGEGAKACVLILNAGIIHRVGPNRLHVEVARALAEAGYTSLRFDLSGIGDSEKRADGLPPLQATLADVREVIDWLQASRNFNRFVLVGLCSGADHSLIYAGSDPRIVGLVLLDPSMPRTRQHFIRYYGGRALRLQTWARTGAALANRIGRLVRTVKAEPSGKKASGKEASGKEASGFPPIDSAEVRAFLKNAYREAVKQKIALLAVFTADRDFLYNYRKQMLDALDGVRFGDLLQLEFFRGADHTFASETERANLVELIVKWMQAQSFKPGPAQQVRKPLIAQGTAALAVVLALLGSDIGG